MSEPCLGQIRMFAGSFAPIDWHMCNGSFHGALAVSSTIKPYSGGPPSGNMAATSIAPAGETTAVNVMQPFLSLNFIIASNGIFPTRE